MNRYRILLAASFLLCTAACLAQSPHLAQGASAFRQGDFDGALKEFQAAQAEQPHDASVMNLIGVTETRLGRIEDANAEYKMAIVADPTLLAPHKNLAVNYLSASRYSEAEEQLKEALKLNNGDPFLHAYLASLYIATGRDQQTIEQLEPAAALIESDPALLYGTATAFLRLHHQQNAMKLIAIGEQKSFFTVEQEYQLALLLAAQKNFSAATERFRQIVRMEPASWSAKEDLAISLLNDNQQQLAIPVLEALTHERPSDANLCALLASAYELAGDKEKALGAYRQAISADPDNQDRYLDYARLLMDMDQYAEAAQIVQTGMTRTSDPYALNIREGSIQMMQGNYPAARATFENAIAAHPEISLGYYALAQCDLKDSRTQESEAVLEKASANTPPDAKVEYLRGVVLSQLGKSDEAIAALKHSIALDDHVAESHYELGLLLEQNGMLPAAKSEFEQVIAIEPSHANAFYQLSKIYARLGDKTEADKMAQRTQELLLQARTATLQHQQAMLGTIKTGSPQ